MVLARQTSTTITWVDFVGRSSNLMGGVIGFLHVSRSRCFGDVGAKPVLQ
jgi:hypothetical protein